MRSVAVTGTGHHVPSLCVTNNELAPRINSSDEWIFERTGVRQRYFADAGETNASLAAAASRAALDDAGLDATSIDAIIFATLSPDTAFPGSGVYLQQHLELSDVPALDIRAQWSGFLYGLSVADAWIRASVYDTVLIVGSEVHSTGLDFSHRGRDVTALFGDGAGAAIVSVAPESGVHRIDLGADGSGAQLLWCEAPGSSRHPSLDHHTLDTGAHFPKMQGRTVFRKAVERLSAEVTIAIDASGVARDEIVFVLHQANQRITDMVASRLSIPLEQFICTIERFGNTTAASIPMAIDVARRDGRIVAGTDVICAAFGSGLTWATAHLRF